MQRLEIKLASDEVDSKTGEFSGYGAVFGNVDSSGDVIAKGAFRRTLKEWDGRGKYPPMLLQHGGMFGAAADDMLPVGQWVTMEENGKGLKVTGRLFAMQTERGQYLYEGLKSGVLDGLSIGYRAKEFVLGTKPTEPRRTLTDVELVELSIVTFPANPLARVSAVKSALTTQDIRDLEADLREKGLSRTDAVKAVAGFRGWLQRDAGDSEKALREEDAADLVALLRRNVETLS